MLSILYTSQKLLKVQIFDFAVKFKIIIIKIRFKATPKFIFYGVLNELKEIGRGSLSKCKIFVLYDKSR